MNPDLSTMSTPLLIALGVLVAAQLTLQVVALVVLARTQRERLMLERKWPWVLVIVLGNLVGAVVFLAVGRRPAPVADTQRQDPQGDLVSRTVQNLYGDDRA